MYNFQHRIKKNPAKYPVISGEENKIKPVTTRENSKILGSGQNGSN